MKLLRSIDLKLASIKMPGDYKTELDEDVIAGMVGSLRRGEMLPPAVLDQGHRLHAGRNRYEAHRRAGRKEMRCDVFEFADLDECELVSLLENLQRKRLPADRLAADRARAVELIAKRIEKDRVGGAAQLSNPVAESPGEDFGNPVAESPGRPATARGEAIREVAKASGVSRQAVEKSLARAAVKDEPTVAPEPTIVTWGVPVSAELVDDARAAQEAFDKADRLLKQAQAALTELQARERFASWAAVANLKEQMHQAARVARACRPVAACAWCAGVVKGCPSCADRNLMGEGEVERLPGELRVEHPDKVLCVAPGSFVAYDLARYKRFKAGRGKQTEQAAVEAVEAWDTAHGDPTTLCPACGEHQVGVDDAGDMVCGACGVVVGSAVVRSDGAVLVRESRPVPEAEVLKGASGEGLITPSASPAKVGSKGRQRVKILLADEHGGEREFVPDEDVPF